MTDSRAIAARLAKIKLDWTGCEDCRLARTRTNQVWGRQMGELREGGIVLIGGAPGKEEDYQGVPFVGKCGEKLDEMCAVDGITDATIIKPLVCRPPGNRDPKVEELEACLGRFQRTLQVLRPHVVVTLGRVSYLWLCRNEIILAQKFSLKKVYESEPVSILEFAGIRFYVVPTYHPGYVLRNKRGRPIVVDHLRLARNLMEVEL